jgi:hypothetical protein
MLCERINADRLLKTRWPWRRRPSRSTARLIAQALNKLTVRAPWVGVPRMIVGQAVLDAGLLDQALQMLGNRAPSLPAQRRSGPAPEHVGVTIRN